MSDPAVEKLKAACPNVANHVTGEPSDYVGWFEWAKRMSRTHKQTRCSGCGLFVIWTPRGDKPPGRVLAHGTTHPPVRQPGPGETRRHPGCAPRQRESVDRPPATNGAEPPGSPQKRRRQPWTTRRSNTGTGCCACVSLTWRTDVDVDQIPAAMVEAAADAYGDALMMSRYTQPGDEDDPDAPEDFAAHDRGEDLKVMRAVLAAALGVCQVREEWGHRNHWADGVTSDIWDVSREQAARDATKTAWSVRRSLIRRLHVTTPTETQGDSHGAA